MKIWWSNMLGCEMDGYQDMIEYIVLISSQLIILKTLHPTFVFSFKDEQTWPNKSRSSRNDMGLLEITIPMQKKYIYIYIIEWSHWIARQALKIKKI